MNDSYIWLIISLILIVSEVIIPGGVVVFLGIAGLIVFSLIKLGIIHTLFSSLIMWFILSIFLLLILRSFFMKYFEGDSRIQNTDEDEDAYRKVAIVSENISPSNNGRIHFRGTTWEAKSDYQISKNEKVIIIKREENIWVVDPIQK